jgi:hypothetical protein
LVRVLLDGCVLAPLHSEREAAEALSAGTADPIQLAFNLNVITAHQPLADQPEN